MELSLLSATDVFVMRPQTLFEDHGAYAVQRTPSEPTYYAGNRLLLGEPLGPAHLDAWAAVFAATFPDPAIRHVRLEWSGGPDPGPTARAAYTAAGYTLDTTLCMSTQTPPPPVPPTPGLEIQPLRAADAPQVRRFLRDCHGESGATFVDFLLADILLRCDTLEGGWWLGRLDGQIAGSMGLFFDGALGRFQAVDTHPAYRRRGVARTMLAQLIGHGLARPQTERLVIAADRDYFAAQFYEDCGFRTAHTHYELGKSPPE